MSERAEREALIQAIGALELENRTLKGQIKSASPSVLKELKEKNTQLRTSLNTLELALMTTITQRKKALDADGSSDKLQVLKAEAIDHCKDRKVDESICKDLESL